MFRVDLNPPHVEDVYLRHLNECFNGWGDRTMFRWSFERTAAGPRADLLVLRENDEWLAGSALTYRDLILPNGERILSGIMTGSFTLPPSRGRGCLSRIIEESRKLTKERGGSVLLAFVTEANASCRRLAAAGSAMFPSFYLVSQFDAPSAAANAVASADPSRLATIYEQENARASHCVRIGYPSFEGWASQMVERAHPCTLLDLGGEETALLEEHPSADRILFLGGVSGLAALLRRAQDRKRPLFLFTMEEEMRRLAVGLGLVQRNGFLAALVADPIRLGKALQTRAAWTSPDSTCLGVASSPWFLGPWRVHGGDRM